MSRAWTKIHVIRDGEKKGIHQRCIADPKKYAATYTIVKGCYYDSYEKKHTNLRDCSGEVVIPLGIHGIITNSVREDGCNRARLYINSGKEKATQGVWSPDSTANSSYVVFK